MKTMTRVKIVACVAGLVLALYACVCDSTTAYTVTTTLAPAAHPAAAIGCFGLFIAMWLLGEGLWSMEN